MIINFEMSVEDSLFLKIKAKSISEGLSVSDLIIKVATLYLSQEPADNETMKRLLTDNNYKTNRLVLNRVIRAGLEGISRSKLYQLSHLHTPQLDERLDKLITNQDIRCETILNPLTNRKQVRYYAI